MPNEKPDISTLGFSLLGLIKMQPSTGYDLRKIFKETPMAHYSSSPGAIYPALKNLQTRGLIRCKSGVGKTGRDTQTYICTGAGTKKLFRWLRSDVTTESVYRELDVVLLRFSYLDLLDDLDWSVEYLKQFQGAARECCKRVDELRQSMASIQPMHGQLALSNGEKVFEAHLKWAESATASIKKNQRKRQ